MKKRMVMIALTIPLAMPLMAQETNQVSPLQAAVPPAQDAPKESRKRQKPTEEQRGELKWRELKLMEKALKEIGVTEEQCQQIIALQQSHMEKMKDNWKRMNKARRILSELQDQGASMQELDVAIKEISDAQTEQLKILVRNRKQMEQILGREKNSLLMKKARELYRSHGRRSSSGMPDRPSVPPVPRDSQGTDSKPPLPAVDSGNETVSPPPGGNQITNTPPAV